MFRKLRQGERGGGKIKALLSLAILGALIFAIIQIVPLYINNYQLQDAMQQEARFVFNPETGKAKTPDEIRDDVEKKVEELGIPVTENQIQVLDDGAHIKIWMDYTIPVDLKVYQLELHFHPLADNTSL
jgi:hypothetical protein